MTQDLLTAPRFRGFPKLSRLNRDIIISEKIDGTNACVGVIPAEQAEPAADGNTSTAITTERGDLVFAQSRKRLITPENDNFGFARWVYENAEYLQHLGAGYHYGEWWGNGINRGYGLGGKLFSLFNPSTEFKPLIDALVDDGKFTIGLRVVPVLYDGPFKQNEIEYALARLDFNGSTAAPGFYEPEGIVVYHSAARTSFKVTLEKDDVPKSRARSSRVE